MKYYQKLKYDGTLTEDIKQFEVFKMNFIYDMFQTEVQNISFYNKIIIFTILEY